MADENTLPIHPVTGLRALGIGRRGPIWPVMGGNGEGDGNTTDDATSTDTSTTDETTGTTTSTSATDDDTSGDDEKLGEGGKKALAAERKARADAEKELATLRAAQKKADRAKLDDTERAKADAKDANDRAEKAERRAALAEAAVTHGLTKADLELLDGVPADQIEDRAKKLAARIKASGKSGSSGGEATGDKGPKKPTSLQGAISAHYGTQ